MKQLIISLLLLLTATTASAQQQDDENLSKRLFDARLAEICLRLNLTDDQKEKFAPLYEQYCNEMSQMVGKPRGHRPMAPGMRPDGRGMRSEGPGMHHGPGMRQERPGMHRNNHGERPNKEDRADKPNKKDNKLDKSDKKDGKFDKSEKKDKPSKADRQRPTPKEGISDAEKVKNMKERMERQKKAQEIRLNYADKFATVLTDKQLVDFYEVENNIQQKMQNRAFKSRPQKR